MALDRGVPARIDRRLFTEIDDNPASQMVRGSGLQRGLVVLVAILRTRGMGKARLINAELTSVVATNERTVSKSYPE
jgi:hypothetical protein